MEKWIYIGFDREIARQTPKRGTPPLKATA
jgi:hypothetical protein